MKFSAKLSHESGQIFAFARIIISAARFTKSAYFVIHSDHTITLGARESLVQGGGVLFCKLAEGLFDEFVFVGAIPDLEIFNEIHLSMPLAHLANVLKPTLDHPSVDDLHLRLGKRQIGGGNVAPIIGVRINFSNMNSGAREVRHDIRVACASKREWHEHQLPEALRKLSFQAHACVSSFKNLKTILDRLRRLANKVLVTLTASGQLIVSVEDDLAKVKCIIPSVRVFRLPAAAQCSSPPSQAAPSLAMSGGGDPYALQNTQQEDGAAPPDSSLEMDRIFKHLTEVKLEDPRGPLDTPAATQCSHTTATSSGASNASGDSLDHDAAVRVDMRRLSIFANAIQGLAQWPGIHLICSVIEPTHLRMCVYAGSTSGLLLEYHLPGIIDN